MDSIKSVLQQKLLTDDTPHYISQEFQDYGYRLAVDLEDLKHKALYIRMAKKENRHLLERAKQFTMDYPKAGSKGRIFMWAFTKLKKGESLAPDNQGSKKDTLNVS